MEDTHSHGVEIVFDSASCAKNGGIEVGARRSSFEQAVEMELRLFVGKIDLEPGARWMITDCRFELADGDMNRDPQSIAAELYNQHYARKASA